MLIDRNDVTAASSREPEPELLASNLPRQLKAKANTSWVYFVVAVIFIQAAYFLLRDFGQSIDEFFILMVVSIVCLRYYLEQRKVRYLLRWGRVVKATVKQINEESRMDRRLTAYLTCEIDGVQREATNKIPRTTTLFVGQVVSALVHNRYPRDAVIYRDAPYRVVPA